MKGHLDRRDFLRHTAAGLAGASLLPAAFAGDKPARPLKVAAIYTEFRLRSHAFNILENFLEPYLFNGQRIDPGMDIVSFYADQTARERDLTCAVARRYRIGVHRSIADALCAVAALIQAVIALNKFRRALIYAEAPGAVSYRVATLIAGLLPAMAATRCGAARAIGSVSEQAPAAPTSSRTRRRSRARR